jgi:hypothetical protein
MNKREFSSRTAGLCLPVSLPSLPLFSSKLVANCPPPNACFSKRVREGPGVGAAVCVCVAHISLYSVLSNRRKHV